MPSKQVGGTVEVVVDVEVDVDVLDDVLDVEVDDVVDVLELVLVVMLEVDVELVVEVDVELVVDVDDEVVLVVVGSGHHSTCGSMLVASCRQRAAVAESSRMLRLMFPVTSRQNWSWPSSTATSAGFPSSPSTTTEVSVTSQSGKAGMALFRASTSAGSVKSSQHGQASNGTVVLVEVDVVLLVLLEVELEVLVDVEVVVLLDVDIEVEVELLVEVEVLVDVDDEVEVVVVSAHHSTCGSTAVASPRQRAAVAESSIMLRSSMPRTSRQD
jgi:hypothetical protein